jgi:hypothetical protein
MMKKPPDPLSRESRACAPTMSMAAAALTAAAAPTHPLPCGDAQPGRPWRQWPPQSVPSSSEDVHPKPRRPWLWRRFRPYRLPVL